MRLVVPAARVGTRKHLARRDPCIRVADVRAAPPGRRVDRRARPGHRAARLLQRAGRRELPDRGLRVHAGGLSVRLLGARDRRAARDVQLVLAYARVLDLGACRASSTSSCPTPGCPERPTSRASRWSATSPASADPPFAPVGQSLRRAGAEAEGVRGLPAGPDRRREPASVRAAGPVRRRPPGQHRHQPLVLQAGAGRLQGAGPWTLEGKAAATLLHGQQRFLRRPDPRAGPALFAAGARDLQLPLRASGRRSTPPISPAAARRSTAC